MPIRTLLFDLGKVIVDFSFDEAYTSMRSLSGLTNDEIRTRLLEGNLMADYESGRVDSPAFVDEVNRRLGTAVPMDRFAEIWSSIFHKTPLIPVGLLEHLRKSYRLVLLSNTNPLHFAMISNTYPHIGHFDALVLSHVVGTMKPGPAIYQHAIAEAQCDAGECLFFDDLADNIAGARSAGLRAEQFTGLAQLKRDLATYGIGFE